MKIVDRKTFLALPAETLFSKYEPCVFGPLEIKGDTISQIDFFSQQIADSVRCHDSGEFNKILFDAEKNGTSFAMDFNLEGRDGLFDDNQLFAVWEPSDIALLHKRLSTVGQDTQ